MAVKSFLTVFCLRVYIWILCSALNFQKGDCSWFLKWGVWGYFKIMFVLKQNGSYSGIILNGYICFWRGFGPTFELAKIFFRKGSYLRTAESSFLSLLDLGGAFMIKSSSSSWITKDLLHFNRRGWHRSCWSWYFPIWWAWFVWVDRRILQLLCI